ncbi:Aldolase-type TIM barrel [Penicillium chermesinum]|uniref:Aldolase-type TIM barrel n=1 Tax=Penicillium chermesinum TaxID=63820 RepID=A0A9W9P615_9EURO|nr:Aldolase-type TIM barrel [Penicillium chermesinum]KAJ5238608.1 Aldolase-type TIM barrel [Penicillium chermesinum]
MALILGQTRPHEDLRTKPRTNFISTTFPDVHAALPNLDILSVGSDAVEIRVDLLVEPTPDGSLAGIRNSLLYLQRDVPKKMASSQWTIRYSSTNIFGEQFNGGVEYVDVELWLPEDIRKRLAEAKGSSVILSAFHDFSGAWKWSAPEAQRIFTESAKYADIVKMIAMVHSVEANYELEYFRSTIKARGPGPLLSAVNMGQLGQLSPAPGQLTAAEINEALHIMGQLPKRDLYAIGSFRATPQSMFIRKCLNELGLPHTFSTIDRGPKGSMESILSQPAFGGASVNPPISSATPYIPTISEAARAIGLVDTIALSNATTGSSVDGAARIIGENATWKGIRATLTQEYVPSAYHGRAAIIVAGSETHASAAIFALRSLDIGTIYTVGFKAVGPLAAGLEPFTSIQSVKLVEQPFVIVSALPPEKSLLVQPLLRHYSSNGRSSPCSTCGKVYLDLTTGPRKGDPASVAASAGWTAYGSEDVDAWTTVETLRLLVGQNVPFDFVRMASGRPLF